MDAYLKLDIFRKLPRDLTEPTFCGALGKSSPSPTTLIFHSLHDLHYHPLFPHHQRAKNIPECTNLNKRLHPNLPQTRHDQNQHRHRDAIHALRRNRYGC